MFDLLRSNLFYAAQRQIIILRTFEPDAKTTDTMDQIGSVNTEMGDEVLRQKKLWVPIGFKIRLSASIVVLRAYPRRCRVLQVAILVQRQCHEVECRRRKFIVVIEQRDKIAGCKTQCVI
jgi:hypothetical protein